MENALVRVPALGDAEVDPSDQRARGVHAGRRVHPRPVRRARLLGRGRLLRARARGRRRHGPARRRVDRGGRAEPRRVGDGLPPLRPPLREPRVHARAHGRDLLDVLRRQVPRARAAGRAAAAHSRRPTRATQELGAAFGEKSGWERVNWFEPNAAPGDESLRPRGWAGRLWSPAIGAEHVACRTTAALFDETSFAKIEIAGSGARRVPRAAVREPGRPRRRRYHVHPDAQPSWRGRVRLHRHAPCGGPLPHRHGDGVRPARPRVDPDARTGRSVQVEDVTSKLRVPRPLGAGRARDPAAADDRGARRSRTCARASSRSAPVPASPCA